MFLESSPDYQNGKASINSIRRVGTVVFLSVLACLCVGCAGISSSGNQSAASNNSNSKISLSPAAVTISSGTQRQFVATVTSTGRGIAGFTNPEIIWHASAGTISSSGLFTAPTATSSTTVTVTATSVADGGAVAVSRVTVVPSNNIVVNVSPTSATIPPSGKQQFSATLTSTSNTAVTWQASAGTISSSGLYTAPATIPSSKVTVTATSVADPTSVASAQVTLVIPTKLSISLNTLPAGTVGVPYSASLTATGGTAPYSWQITAGSLPPGLSLGASTGLISGTPLTSGTFSFTAKVTDASSTTVSTSLTLAVNPSTTGNFDGPAELPRVYVQSDLADTPAPGSVITVAQGGDFQAALNSAKCGDTITLQAGAVFVGSFTVPAQTCDDGHWIIIRTSTPDSSLPPEGTRISPCYAGVASLPGRPAFNCTSTRNVLAMVEFGGVGSGPLLLQNGASHYRFIGLEITRTPATGIVYNLVVNQNSGASDHIIFDRSWLHGTAQDETQRAIMLSGTTYAALVDSYTSDFHCVAVTGACIDSQVVAGGLGNIPMGPYKIVDNFLEAAGENIMFGGGSATVTPADIEIRRNHMFKPMTWMQGQPGFVGGVSGHPFIVKNLLEMKNAQRLLIDGNIMEYSWGGFSQDGFAILLTPKNQSGSNGTNLCPMCQLTDVTIRYSTISHVGSGMTMGSGLSDNGGVPLASERYSIHDLVIDDIDPAKYSGNGNLAQIGMGLGCPTLNNILINHITAFPQSTILNLGNDVTNPKISQFTFTNNLLNSPLPPFTSTGGGAINCSVQKTPLAILQACFAPYTYATNAMIGSMGKYATSDWPSGNLFPTSEAAVDFVNYNGGIGGDYHLQSSSPYKNAGSDGKDLGADIDAVDAAIAGVQ